MQQGKRQNQTECPKSQQKYERKGAEISQERFADGPRFYLLGNARPGSPCISIEKRGQPEYSPYPARQDDGFKGIEQDNENQPSSGNDAEEMHDDQMLRNVSRFKPASTEQAAQRLCRLPRSVWLRRESR